MRLATQDRVVTADAIEPSQDMVNHAAAQGFRSFAQLSPMTLAMVWIGTPLAWAVLLVALGVRIASWIAR
jgi:hypothetical protein